MPPPTSWKVKFLWTDLSLELTHFLKLFSNSFVKLGDHGLFYPFHPLLPSFFTGLELLTEEGTNSFLLPRSNLLYEEFILDFLQVFKSYLDRQLILEEFTWTHFMTVSLLFRKKRDWLSQDRILPEISPLLILIFITLNLKAVERLKTLIFFNHSNFLYTLKCIYGWHIIIYTRRKKRTKA